MIFAESESIEALKLILQFLATVLTTVVGVYLVKINKKQGEAAVLVAEVATKQDTAAVEVKAVKATLADNTAKQEERSNKQDAKLEEIHLGVNGMNKVIEQAGFARGVKSETDKSTS